MLYVWRLHGGAGGECPCGPACWHAAALAERRGCGGGRREAARCEPTSLRLVCPPGSAGFVLSCCYFRLRSPTPQTLTILTPTTTQPRRSGGFTHCSRTCQSQRCTPGPPTPPGSLYRQPSVSPSSRGEIHAAGGTSHMLSWLYRTSYGIHVA